MDQRAAERDALLLAAGQLPGKALAEAVEPDGLEQRVGLLAVLRFLAAEFLPVRLHDLERQQDVVDDLAPRQQVRVLKRHAGDLHRPAHAVAEDDDVTGIGRNEPGHELHKRRLAAARGADDRGELAAADGEARVLQGENAARGAAIGQRDIADVDRGGHVPDLGRNPPFSSPAKAGDPTAGEFYAAGITTCARMPAADIRW